MAETQKLAELTSTQSVSALGLRWAALRGMLNSPLITAEDQRALRDELLVELATLEQDFSTLQSRNPMEISAKVDIAKSALRDKIDASEMWMIDLLDSIQADLQNFNAAVKTGAQQPTRPPVNLSRAHQQRPDESETTESSTSSAA
ncbi:hypothetical protein [Microvirga guangxiensis]|uniref:Uncharacterized protein n=1 Tax=Microvirga guangxiensis TaxID=549386 RepID=A0A1G5GPT7_9HYPH|nr:hypothetical protein [Microvirga guangxiensis]SCY53220.1 hypothetical protein SAMN02927923_01585 [Microvirga guangxiensis]